MGPPQLIIWLWPLLWESWTRPRWMRSRQKLFSVLSGMGRVIVAYSGGTDSAYLAWAAHRVLGADALAITADSASIPESHKRDAEDFVRQLGIPHEYIETHEFENPDYLKNDKNRCFHCKDELFARLEEVGLARGISNIIYGVNQDDLGDYRPGQNAAKIHQVKSPLVEAGLTKAEIRELSRMAGLPDMGPAGISMPELAHSVRHARDDRERENRRARRRGNQGPRFPAVSRAILRRTGSDRSCQGRASACAHLRDGREIYADLQNSWI